MAKSVAVLIKDEERHYEGLRFSLGLLLEEHRVHMFVLNHPIEVSEEYLENMSFIDEMGGARFSNHDTNVTEHAFERVSIGDLASRLQGYDVVVPF